MSKTAIIIQIDSNMKKTLERRAKKEFLKLEELITDILRRSTLSYKGKTSRTSDSVDDKFLTYFSRKNRKKK